MKDNWKLHKRKYDNLINQLLANRNIDQRDHENFLNPDFNTGLLDAGRLPDFEKFRRRMIKAVRYHEKIGIFADYDADGIPGAAFLAKALDKLGLQNAIYIPSREEGYGLSEQGIDYLSNQGCRLIITVDMGIRNNKEADICRNKKIDLIITDHHIPGDTLPSALAVVNPKILKSKYGFSELCGAGVIYKLIYGLKKDFAEIDENFLKWNLDLIAIATISDVVPLISENRIIARFGLMVLQKTKNLGLRALYVAAGLEQASIGVYQVGFALAPRLNAPGRLAGARKSFDLLTTADPLLAKKIAQELNEENELRQKMMEELLLDADRIIQNKKLTGKKIIVLKGKWAKGILGPSASRIVEKYCRPVIILSQDQKNISGSARSFADINISAILSQCSPHLEKFGGHSGAAGLTLKPGHFEAFVDQLEGIAEKQINSQQLVKIYKADAKMNFDDLNLSVCHDLRLLEPYGMGNPRPTFVTELAKLISPKFVGSALNHLSAYIEHQNKKIKSIYFNFPYDKSLFSDDAQLDLLYSVDEEMWNGKRYLKINIIDIMNRS